MIPASYDPPRFLLDGIPSDGRIQALYGGGGVWETRGVARKGAEVRRSVVTALFCHNRQYFVVDIIDFPLYQQLFT
jgi:hypothetical protein